MQIDGIEYMAILRNTLKGISHVLSVNFGILQCIKNLRSMNKLVFLFFSSILFSMIVGIPSGSTNNQTFAQITSPAEDQVSIKECVISSGECTVNDILIDESGILVCDPRQFDCTSYLTSSNSGNQDQTQTQTQNTVKAPLTKPKTCNPKNAVCSSKDLLINDDGDVICNPTKTDCSRYFRSVNLEPTYQMFTICNPNFEPCKRSDVIVDAMYNVICNPIEADCSSYLVSQEPLEKYAYLTGGNPNAKVLQATDPPLQYCNPKSENCTADYRQIPGMQPWDCFIIITTDQKVCDTTPRSTQKNSIFMTYPHPPYREFLDAQEKEIELRNERAQFEDFACEFADQASERVVAFASCWKVADEALDVAGAVKDAHMSKSEMAFCGLGTANVIKNGPGVNVEGHETSALQVLDVPSYVGGKASKLTCKATGSIAGTSGLRDKLYEWFGRGDGKIVAKFLNHEYQRIKKEMPQWCAKYGVTPNEVGKCWDLEFSWEDCNRAQKFWNRYDPDKYGYGKPIKLRNGKVVPIVDGQFEFPCNYPPIPHPIDQVCREEPIVCTPDTSKPPIVPLR
jgi:hypothetical protein